MKVYINRQPISGPWGGGAHFINAFHTYAERPGIELLHNNNFNISPEIILLAGLENNGPGNISVEQAIMYKLSLKPDCKIVLRVNENDARKGTNNIDNMLMKIFPHMDGIVFVSNWLRDYFCQKGWSSNNCCVIYNGVDKQIFNAQPKLNNGKLNIVAHHWSDNRMKGADIYEQIDKFVGNNIDQYTFTYIGRHRCNFQHTNVIKPLCGKALGQELGKYDVYVSASRFDPGPNHILEAMACELPTYVHEHGGGCVEFAGPRSTFSNFEQLIDILVASQKNLVSTGSPIIFPNNAIISSWQECVEKYNIYLEQVWKQNN